MSGTNAGPEDYSKTPMDQLWAEWKVKHGKKYETKEDEEYRFGIFKESLEKINVHNASYNRGETTYFCGLNQFADLKQHEVCCGGLRRKDVSKEDAAHSLP